MEYISRLEAMKLSYPEITRVGVQLESGFRFSYYEFEHTNRSFIDYDCIILFNTKDELSNWIMEQKRNYD